MLIDTHTHKIKTSNYHRKKYDKKQIIIDLSLRKNDYHINRFKCKEYGNFTGWSTYTISRNGDIFEHYNPEYYSDFISKKKVDKHAISIIIENMGMLEFNDNKFVNHLNEKCEDDLIYVKKFMSHKYWEMINDEQLLNLQLLIDYLCKTFNIPNDVIKFQHYNQNSEKFSGVLFRVNYNDEHNGYHPQLENIIKK